MYKHTTVPIIAIVLITLLTGFVKAAPPVGDLDGNFWVDINDLSIFAGQWLDDPNGSANINGDDKINMADFCLLANNWENGTEIVITEFMANKNNGLNVQVELVRQPGEFVEVSPDWIELYNISDRDVNLAGWYLTDNENDLTRWAIPAITLSPGDYKVICASGKEEKYYEPNYPYLDPNGYYHTNFELGRGGEYLALVRHDGVTIADKYAPEYPNQRGYVSYGYCSNTGEYGYFENPTRGAANSSTCLTQVVDDTKFSHDRGFYDASFYVAITTETPDAVIRYTTDGSTPTESHGTVYAGSFQITTTTCLRAMAYKTDYLPTNVDTHTYIFLDDVLTQDGDGFPATWGTYWGAHPADYEMDPDVVDDPLYNSTIKDDLKAVPTISLVMSLDDWFNPSTDLDVGGIYANPQWYYKEFDYGQRSERAVSAELIDPCGLEEFQIDAAIKLSGWNSMNQWNVDKFSMRLKFREPIGPTKLDFPLFGNDPAESFDTIVLDARYNNSWPKRSQAWRAQYTRDQFAYDLQNAMSGGYASHGRKVHLYINGLYWGLYGVHERPDESFAATYFGGKKDDYDCLKHNVNVKPQLYEVINGTDTEYTAMFNAAYSGLTAIEQYLDVPNYIDYVLLNVYGGNWDWFDNNYYASRNAYDPAGRWRYHCWDAEHIFEDVTKDILDDDEEGQDGVIKPHWRLVSDDEYVMLFADRVHKHFFNDGVLTPSVVAAMYQVRLDEVDRAVVGESARWGDNRDDHLYDRDDEWIDERNRLLNTYFPARTGIVLNHFKTIYNLYPDVDAPVFTPHGGWDMTGFTVTMTGSGTIWYTTDGNDPRLPGGSVNTPSATEYSSPVSITETTNLKARVKDSGDWSALNEATYAVGPVADNLRITEIMYHPQDTNEPNDPNEEFIELMNIGTGTINLKLVSFTRGISFTFPLVTLDPNGYIIVVANQSAFDDQYPGFSGVIAGEYTGSLANDGERIRLEDANDQIIHNFIYRDGWYDVTDGDGFSLTIRDACDIDPCDWGLESSWGASTYRGGSPGEGDTGPRDGDIVISEILAHSDVEPYDWIELYNTTDETIDIGGWFLSDSDINEPNLMKYQISEGTTVEPNEYIEFTEEQFGDQNDPNCHVAFALSENGETAYLSSGIAGELTLTGFREERSFRASDPDVSFGLYTKSSLSASAGDPTDFVAMSQSTKGQPNIYPPVIGPIVITEIMYKPADDDPELEYIKLENISGSAVTLQRYYDDEEIYVQWKFTDGIEYTFPPGTTIGTGDYIYVVYDVTEFETEYTSVPTAKIFGPFEDDDEGKRTKLSNSGEDLELSKPGDKDEQTGERYYILVDRVVYSDGTHPEPGFIDPWPTTPDGDGDSLHKDPNSAYGNDVDNWVADTPSPN